MKLRKSVVLFVVMALVVLTAMSFAQTTKLKRIGLYTFCTVKGQAPTPATMKGLFEIRAADIKTGFDLAGNSELYQPFMDQMKTAEWTDTTLPIGEVLPWMLFRSHEQVKVARNIEWAGKEPLPVFIVPVTKDWKQYEFVIPHGCGNIALSSKVTDLIQPAVCSLTVTPARANANDPITVDMSGSLNAKSMTVEVTDAQGLKLATQELTPQSPKWQTKFDKPGEYTFKGTATGMDGKVANCVSTAKVAINFPPICKLWTSCMPCEDYVGRPITFDASGSSDPDGQIAKVVFELLDANGNVIDTCVTTRKPWTWEKVFTKAGTYTINTTVFDNDGAQSPASDPCRLTFEVTQKKLFWTVGGRPRGLWRQHGAVRLPARRAVRLDHPRPVELHPDRRRRHSFRRQSLEDHLQRRSPRQRPLPELLPGHRPWRELGHPAQGREPQVRHRHSRPGRVRCFRQVDEQRPAVLRIPPSARPVLRPQLEVRRRLQVPVLSRSANQGLTRAGDESFRPFFIPRLFSLSA